MATSKSLLKDKFSPYRNLLMTVLILFVLRIFNSIPTPGINIEYFDSVIENNQALYFVNMLTGSGLSNMTVMALSIAPYISASIIIQLLTNISTKLKDLQQGMNDDRKKYDNITIGLGIVLAFVQALAMSIGYGKQGMLLSYTWYWVLIVSLVWTAGAGAASILGKKIQDKYGFNGISLILLMNIVSSYPSDGLSLYNAFAAPFKWYIQIPICILIILIIAGLFLYTYYIQEAEKIVVINYSNKSGHAGKRTNELPIKLCPGGVVPMIFAASIMSFPVMIAGAFTSTEGFWVKLLISSYWFNPSDMLPTLGVIIYIALIFGFSYFYIETSLSPFEMAERFKKSGGSINGIRPGKPTAEYLNRQIKSLVGLGALALTIVALIPIIISGLFGLPNLSFLGTSVIITVGVISELIKQLSTSAQIGRYTSRKGGLF